MTVPDIVADLQNLANDTALVHQIVETENRVKGAERQKLLAFMTKTYAHNQRRRWEQKG